MRPNARQAINPQQNQGGPPAPGNPYGPPNNFSQVVIDQQNHPLNQETCCFCFPLKCGLQTMAVIAGIGFLQGILRLMMFLNKVGTLGRPFFAIATVIFIATYLFDGLLAVYWLCASFRNAENQKHFKALVYSFYVSIIGTILYGIAYVFALNTDGKKYLRARLNNVNLNTYNSMSGSRYNLNVGLGTDGKLTEEQKNMIVNVAMMKATAAVIFSMFVTVCLNVYWLNCAKKYIQLAQRGD